MQTIWICLASVRGCLQCKYAGNRHILANTATTSPLLHVSTQHSKILNNSNLIALLNPETSTLIQKRHSYTRNLARNYSLWSLMLQLLVNPDLTCVGGQHAHDQFCLNPLADLLFPDTLHFRYTSGYVRLCDASQSLCSRVDIMMTRAADCVSC